MNDSTILPDSTIQMDSIDNNQIDQQILASAIGHSQCTKSVIAIKDAIEVLNGRWRLSIIYSLLFKPKRFKQISRDVDGITDKMLSKELKELELNQLIQRKIYNTFPPTVEYSITEHGRSLKNLIEELEKWGMEHRKKILGK